jgi:hypothetical protein
LAEDAAPTELLIQAVLVSTNMPRRWRLRKIAGKLLLDFKPNSRLDKLMSGCFIQKTPLFTMAQETKKPFWSRFRVLASLFIWSLLVALVYVIWQAQENTRWASNDDGARARLQLAIGAALVLVVTFIASLVIVRGWRHLPASRRTRFWLGSLSLLAGILWCSWLLAQDVRMGEWHSPVQQLWWLLIWSGVFLTGLLYLYSLRTFFRWLFSWRILKRGLLALGLFAVLVVLFYTEENWRGRRAWNECRRELEAKGERLDFKAFIPPPVPDEQNFAMAPVLATAYNVKFYRKGQAEEGTYNYRPSPLDMELSRTNYATPTNMVVGSWAESRLTDLEPWQEYFRAAALTNIWSCDGRSTNIEITLLDTNEFPTSAMPQTPAADVLLALSRYEWPLQEIQKAAQRPAARFPVNYQAECPSGIVLMHLSKLKKCAQVLQLRAIAELQQGKTVQALADVKLILRLADSVHSEPILISHLVRAALAGIALQPVWEGLSNQCWSDAESKDLADELQKLDFVADWQFALHAERAAQLADIDYMRTHRDRTACWFLFATVPKSFEAIDQIGNLFPNLPDSLGNVCSSIVECLPEDFIAGRIQHLPPDGWYDQNKKVLAQTYETHLFPMANLDKHIISQSCATNCMAWLDQNRQTKNISPQNVLLHMLLPSIPHAAQRFAQIQSTMDMALLACALERYRNLHQEYPETLTTLSPSILKKIPPDVVNGEPLHYRRTKDGRYQLYSIGWNGKDDGGVAELSRYDPVDRKTGDWVWQYPPTRD